MLWNFTLEAFKLNVETTIIAKNKAGLVFML